mmetsp:Transcript_25548/g.55771  ORF Transcript_25548/g.55771 Transcript_25548/m.55771 type:complete len:175 (-) Transcript_25548:456-980(-)|eukprot:CAMPEP_0180546186 /NCGR_PEP_ID=MMETSP1036_2-20121128/70432_1 /TAXON_ID=632150 /ORGANISM="Azadinium spinosum, Strain 3D9" /LENGTH=174 /DNA_ID=CAMNT_0022561265 /DNA_START=64 /DNA_END=588 /DNA_ORIENTATION=+
MAFTKADALQVAKDWGPSMTSFLSGGDSSGLLSAWKPGIVATLHNIAGVYALPTGAAMKMLTPGATATEGATTFEEMQGVFAPKMQAENYERTVGIAHGMKSTGNGEAKVALEFRIFRKGESLPYDCGFVVCTCEMVGGAWKFTEQWTWSGDTIQAIKYGVDLSGFTWFDDVEN